MEAQKIKDENDNSKKSEAFCQKWSISQTKKTVQVQLKSNRKMLGSGHGQSNKNQTVITKKTKIKEKHRIVDPQYQNDPTLYQKPHLLGNEPVMGPQMIQPRNKSYSSSSSSSSDKERMQTMPPQNLTGETLIPPRQNVIVTDPSLNMMNTGQINPQVNTMMMANQGIQGEGLTLPKQDLKYTHKQEIDQGGEKISFVEKVKQKFRH